MIPRSTIHFEYFLHGFFLGFNNFSQRSHSCGEFRHTHIGQEVKICGWVQYKRLMFLVVRDWSGLVQVLLPESMVNFPFSIRRKFVTTQYLIDIINSTEGIHSNFQLTLTDSNFKNKVSKYFSEILMKLISNTCSLYNNNYSSTHNGNLRVNIPMNKSDKLFIRKKSLVRN